MTDIERVLFILPGPVYPPESGPQHHSFGLLKSVSQRFECHVVGFSSGHDADERWMALRAVLGNTIVVKTLPYRQGTLRAAARLYRLSLGLPVSLATFAQPELHRWLAATISTRRYDLVHFDTFNVSSYVKECAGVPTVLVPHDAYSLEARRGFAASVGALTKLSYLWKYWAYTSYERRVYPQFTKVCPVSDCDTARLRSLSPGIDAETLGIPIGEQFARGLPSLQTEHAPPHVVCAGFLSNDAIAAGMIEFLEEVYPEIRRSVPALKVTIWGRNPTARLRRTLRRSSEIDHVEYVKDYRGFLSAASVYVLPQRSGAGIQVKVQQAMAMGIPVVARTHVLISLGASDGVHAFARDGNTGMAQAVVALANDADLRRRIGAAGAGFVVDTYNGDLIGERLAAIYHRALEKHKRLVGQSEHGRLVLEGISKVTPEPSPKQPAEPQ